MNYDKRQSRRLPTVNGPYPAILQIGGSLHDSQVIEMSAEGFGIETDPGIAVTEGQTARLVTKDAEHDVEIRRICRQPERLRLGLLRVRTKSTIPAAARRRDAKRSSGGLPFEVPLPLLTGGAVCLMIAIAPLLVTSGPRWWLSLKSSKPAEQITTIGRWVVDEEPLFARTEPAVPVVLPKPQPIAPPRAKVAQPVTSVTALSPAAPAAPPVSSSVNPGVATLETPSQDSSPRSPGSDPAVTKPQSAKRRRPVPSADTGTPAPNTPPLAASDE